jgi:hypothetical protein
MMGVSDKDMYKKARRVVKSTRVKTTKHECSLQRCKITLTQCNLLGNLGFKQTKLQVNFRGMMCKEGVMTQYSKMHDGNGNGNIVFQQLATPNCHH